MRIIEIIADCGHADTLLGIAEQFNVEESWVLPCRDEQRCSTRLLVKPDDMQKVLDAIQAVLDKIEDKRIILLPVEGVLPLPVSEGEKNKEKEKSAVTRSREELYQQIASGAKLDSNFLLMVLLSTVVATIGLIEDSVAIVIGAMVIAPLLGPNIALAFATALGETALVWKSLKTNIAGMLLALSVAIVISLFWPISLETREIVSRTTVGIDEMVLALASGAAAVLALAAGWANSFVGVMVAVALLPPTVTLGLMLGTGQFQSAIGAALLLAVNIVSVNLAAKLTFVFKGVKPRTWLEKQKVRQSMITYVVFWIIALAVLIVAIQMKSETLLQ